MKPTPRDFENYSATTWPAPVTNQGCIYYEPIPAHNLKAQRRRSAKAAKHQARKARK